MTDYQTELREKFDWQALKRDCVANAVETLGDFTLDELHLHDLTDGESIIGRQYIGTVFGLTPSGKYYMPFACGNVEACPECNGSGNVDNPNVNTSLHDDYTKIVHDMRMELFREHGAWCNGDWPDYKVARLHELDNLVNYYAPTLECEQCGGLGSAEAYQDSLWNEALDQVCEENGMWAQSGEGDPCDLFVARWVSFDEIVRWLLENHVETVTAWLKGGETIRSVKGGLRAAKSAMNKVKQLEKGGLK